MKVIERTAKEWQPTGRRESAPMFAEAEQKDCVVIDKTNQQIVAIQIQLPDDTFDVTQQITRIMRHDLKWAIDKGRPARMSGIASANKVFGTLEPNRLRQRFGCKSAALDRDAPELRALLGQLLTSSYKQLETIEPHRTKDHQELIESKIHPDWLIAEMPFTSGIINYSAALPYHRDSGNVLGSWSVMVALRKHMSGGQLHLPEYGVVLGVPDRSIIFFNGQAIWHGVTPMVAAKKDAYRFTIVYYAKRKICDCLSISEEQHRAAVNAMHSTQPLDQNKWKQ
jgi:hypothetical protein